MDDPEKRGSLGVAATCAHTSHLSIEIAVELLKLVLVPILLIDRHIEEVLFCSRKPEMDLRYINGSFL